MAQQRSTEDLLTEFSQNPGAENAQLEFKSKEVLNSKGQKKKVVRILAAMANRAGGTMISGVRHQDNGLLYQSFSPNDEARQELTHIAQEYTSPQLQRYWEIAFENCMGHTVLRIDVDRVRDRLIRVDYQGEYQVWIRDEDGMRKMTTAEIDEFYRQRASRQEASTNDLVERRVFPDFKPKPVSTPDNQELFPRRGVVRTDDHLTAVFGSGFLYDYLEKSHTVRLRTEFPGREGYAEIPSVLKAAEEHLDARLDRGFGYTIRISDLQLVGRSLESLNQDLGRLDTVVTRLEEASSGGWNYGPVIAGVVPIDFGLLWFELQQETDSFTRSNLRIVLQDIPFDQSPLQAFYDEIGTSPPVFDHKHGLQFVTFKGRQVEPLQNPKLTPLTKSELIGPLYVTTDNPFFGWPEGVESSMENPLPDHLTRGIASIDRIPFQVGGGYRREGNDEFALNYLHFTKVQGIHPTMLIIPFCWQR